MRFALIQINLFSGNCDLLPENWTTGSENFLIQSEVGGWDPSYEETRFQVSADHTEDDIAEVLDWFDG